MKSNGKVSPNVALLAVCGLTAAAFALRLEGFDHSLFGDELYTFADTQHGLSEIPDGLAKWEITPPLYFGLAWAASQLGDPTITIRLPSLILATATVPITYLLGARTVGRTAGLLAAGFVTLSPFAIFYGSEARPYATLAFLAVASTLSLLLALERGGLPWWALYVACSALVLYTHYTGACVLVAQSAWAAWYRREHLRELVLASVAIALAYAPWIPSLLEQRSNGNVEGLGRAVGPLSLHSGGRDLLRAFPGHPLVPLRDLPGRAAVVVFAVALGATLVIAVLRVARRDRGKGRPEPSPHLVLVALVALATPLGLALYSLAGTDLFAPRNLIASLPAATLLLAWLVTRLGRVPAAIAAAAVLAVLAIGAVQTLDHHNRRTPLREAAQFIAAEGRPGDGVELVRFRSPEDPLSRDTEIQLKGRYRVFYSGENGDRAWDLLTHGHRLFFVRPPSGFFSAAPRPPKRLAPRIELRASRRYEGLGDIVVFEFAPADR